MISLSLRVKQGGRFQATVDYSICTSKTHLKKLDLHVLSGNARDAKNEITIQ